MKKILFLAFVLFAFAAQAQKTKGQNALWISSKYKIDTLDAINSVHDGDGFRDKQGEVWTSYRFIGCDAPEVPRNEFTNYQPFGKESGDFLRQLIKEKSAVVQKRGKDGNDRTLANAQLNGKDLAQLMIEKGLAWYEPSKNTTKAQARSYKIAEDEAKLNKVGLWSGENPIRPSVWRKKYWQKTKRVFFFFKVKNKNFIQNPQ